MEGYSIFCGTQRDLDFRKSFLEKVTKGVSFQLSGKLDFQKLATLRTLADLQDSDVENLFSISKTVLSLFLSSLVFNI